MTLLLLALALGLSPHQQPPRHAHPATGNLPALRISLLHCKPACLKHIQRADAAVLRRARSATRIVFWVCPELPDGTPVTKPDGVCFRDFWGH